MLHPFHPGLTLLFGFLLAPGLAAARDERLELRHVRLELPGAPVAIVAADVDADGRGDLAVAVVYTEWDQLSFEERTQMSGVDGLVEMLTVVPALADRRELRLYRGLDGEGFESLPPLAIDATVLSLSAGPPGAPVVVLTDDGVAALRARGGALVLEPLLEERPALARSRTFVPELGIVHDLDADGRADLLVPTLSGAVAYPSDAGGLPGQPSARLVYPRDPRPESARRRHVPLAEVRDVTGDGLPDLLLPHHRDFWEHFYLLVNLGEGRFAPPLAPLGEPPFVKRHYAIELGEDDHGNDPGAGDPEASDPEASGTDEPPPPRAVHFGDLDGDGVAEYVTEESLARDDVGWRKELKEAKRPPYRLRFYRQEAGHGRAAEPYRELEVVGYAFVDQEGRLPGGFQDLDGDGRQDLVTLTFDFSLLQAVRILATQRIDIGLDFHVWCQAADGSFRAVSGLDLSGRFKLRLDDLRIGKLSQFAGDFDGDGRADFVQLGRGARVTIHRGREGCAYGAEPDLVLELEEAPKDLALTRVEDLDGDGLTDLLVLHPRPIDEVGVTAPVALDLYLSGDAP